MNFKHKDSTDPDAWLRYAERNFAHAEMRPGKGSAEVECFCAQQAAEMAAKAVYVAMKIPHPRVHDIGKLLDGLKQRGVAVPDAVDAADNLSVYGVSFRPPTNATEKEHVEAVRLARAVLNWAKGEVKKRGA